jgi:dUTP pyrophosphatase
MEVRFRALVPHAVLPRRAREADAGLDLSAAEEAHVKPGRRTMVPTGLSVEIPEGHAGLVLPRSGLASRRGLTLANAPGLIDAGYRGEIVCAVVNLDPSEDVHVAAGDRIAQLVIVQVPDAEPVWAHELRASERGTGGFGSSGTAPVEGRSTTS